MTCVAVGFSIENKGFIGTGVDWANYKDEFWEWDQSSNVWSKKANFGGGTRIYAFGLSIGNKGYIGTGLRWDNNVRNYYQDVWEFDPSAITDLEEISTKNNFFYPNPASDFITVNIRHTDNPHLTLNIYNISGELIHSAVILQNQQKINIKGLSSGIYIAEIKSKGGLDKQKLIVQR
jgi:hypothetical protein